MAVRILLLTSEFAPVNGGIGTYAREIAVAATELGADVTLVAPDYGQDNNVDDRRLPFGVLRFHGGAHSLRDLPSQIMLARRHVAAANFDVVHAADWPFFIPAALARGMTTARILMTVHGSEINETQTPFKRLAIRCADVFGTRTTIAANSRFTRELFRRRFAIDASRVHAIPLGVSDFWFGERASRVSTRKAHGIAADRIVMITVARLTRRKGHLLALSALAALPAALRDKLTWLLIGPDGESDYVLELRGAAASLDCDIRFLGRLSDTEIRDLYGAADFFCLTGLPESSGRVEGFGLVYLEAGAAGLPSLATDIGGVGDAVTGGRTGLLVPPSRNDIAEALTRLASDAAVRSAFAEGTVEHSRQLSWKRCAAETYGLTQSATAEIDAAYHSLGAHRARRLSAANLSGLRNA
jgi:phosphatidyl-myo-inositol dimannoside synthase